MKLQHFHTDLDDKIRWMDDAENLLKSPAVNLDDVNIPKDKLTHHSDLVEVTTIYLATK